MSEPLFLLREQQRQHQQQGQNKTKQQKKGKKKKKETKELKRDFTYSLMYSTDIVGHIN